MPIVVTVEEGALEGGFGSALLEAANGAGLETRNIVALGCRIDSSNTPSAVNCWPIWAWILNGICGHIRRALGRELHPESLPVK